MFLSGAHEKLFANNMDSLFFKTIADTSDIGIAIIDMNGYFVYYNKMMGEIEDLRDENMIGKHIFDIFPSYNKQTSSIYKCIREKEPIYDDIQTYINFKGKKITSIVTDLPIVEDGKVVGVIEIVKDVDKIKTLYESFKNLFANSEISNRHISKKSNSAYYQFEDFLTLNKGVLDLIERVKRSSNFGSNTLIYGETGTGKEIIAQSIHNYGKRCQQPFIAQNCAAIPENLMESILFGTTRGSFTGASNTMGLFEQANGGTLLLDEINSLPVTLQAKLLRVLQESRIRRIGDTTDRAVDVHVIATINESPDFLVKEGKLREDLFFRLSTMNINIPPLRERPEDIKLLLKHFTEKKADAFEISPPVYSRDALNFFYKYEWRGNIRELINVVEYILINGEYKDSVTPEHFPFYLHCIYKEKKTSDIDMEEKEQYTDIIDKHEKELIFSALEANDWNVSQAARSLNIKRQTLQNKIKRLNITKPGAE